MNNNGFYELSTVQKKLYIYHKMYPNDPSYNLSFCYRITGNLDLEKLKSSLELLINSIKILKVSFIEKEGVPYQKINDNKKYYIEIIELKEEESEETVLEYINKKANQVINLKDWPLFDIKIFKSAGFYYLTINMAHIIADVYSYYTVLEQLSKLYNFDDRSLYNLNNNNTSNLNFVVQEKSLSKGLEFFRNQLNSFESLEIKEISEGRDNKGCLKGKRVTFSLDKGLSTNVKTFVKYNNLSTFSFFLTVYLILLYKLTHQKKLVVGIPLPNRKDKKLKRVFGYFVNTLPFGIDLSNNISFKDLCNVIKKKMFSLLRYQDFDMTNNLTGILNNTINSFESLNNAFTYYRQELSLKLNNCLVEELPVEIENLKFPFSVSIENKSAYFNINVESGSYFQYVDFKNCFHNIINTVISNESIPVNEIELLNPDEIKTVNKLVNTGERFVINEKIQESFELQAEKFSNKTAVKFNKESITYKDLNEKANQIAHFLNNKLSDKQKHIVISLERSIDLISVILGVLKANRTYVPIDPVSPVERIQYILNELDNPIIITQEHFRDRFAAYNNTLVLEEISKKLSNFSAKNPAAEKNCDQTAYIIYTSGSTGKPKGVEISHYNVLRLFKSTDRNFGFNSKDVWTLFHSYAFDFSVWEIFGALLYGGTLIVVPEKTTKSPNEFYQLLKDEQVTILNQTPSYFRQLIKVDGKSDSYALDLRYIIFGGEKLNFEIFKKWNRLHHKKIKLVNMYGITETTVHVTFYLLTEKDFTDNKGSIIGKPVSDLEIYIVDHNFKIVPAGIPGEIIVGGAGVSKGYYKKEELTKERFIYSPTGSGIVYRTGDLGRYLPDGNIEYIGRIDKQVQLRGYRIELGEVESAINSYSECKDCVVNIHNFSEGDDRLIAYIIPESGDFNKQKLRLFLTSKLPGYMIPSIFITIEKVPLTINGKVDYDALPKPVVPISFNESTNNEIEKKIMNLWKEVIQVEHINPNDNFFDVGGTSLHVSEIYYKLKEVFKLRELSMIDLFEYTTVNKLASYIKSQAKFNNITSERTLMRKEALKQRVLAGRMKGEHKSDTGI